MTPPRTPNRCRARLEAFTRGAWPGRGETAGRQQPATPARLGMTLALVAVALVTVAIAAVLGVLIAVVADHTLITPWPPVAGVAASLAVVAMYFANAQFDASYRAAPHDPRERGIRATMRGTVVDAVAAGQLPDGTPTCTTRIAVVIVDGAGVPGFKDVDVVVEGKHARAWAEQLAVAAEVIVRGRLRQTVDPETGDAAATTLIADMLFVAGDAEDTRAPAQDST